jgi:hypothetical protein
MIALDPRCFDALVSLVSGAGSRLGVLRCIAAVLVVSSLLMTRGGTDVAGAGNGAMVGGGGDRHRRRNARHRHDPGVDKGDLKSKRRGSIAPL